MFVSALALGAMTSMALAEEPSAPATTQAGPVTLTEAQMDGVTAGQLIEVIAVDVVDVSDNVVEVAVPVNVAAAVAVLGASNAIASQLGRINQ